MKKLLLLLLSVGIISAAQAQFGVRAGYSTSNFSDTNFTSKSGFHLGGYYRYGNGFLSIEPGLQYSQKGYETQASTSAEVSERLGYLDIPVLLRLNSVFLPFLNVFAGPQASLLLSRNYDLGGITNTSTEVIRGYDIGGVVGVGVGFESGFNAQLSYDLGFTDLNYFNSNVKNRVLKVSVGFDF
jgi:hypothetical protein